MARIKRELQWKRLGDGEPAVGTRVIVAFRQEGVAKPQYQLGRWGKAAFRPGIEWWMEVVDAPEHDPEPVAPPAPAGPLVVD